MQRARSNAIAASNDFFNVFSKKFNDTEKCVIGAEGREGLLDYVQQVRLDNLHKSYQEGSIADFIFSGVKYINEDKQTKNFNTLYNNLYDVTTKARTLRNKFILAKTVELNQLKKGIEDMMRSDKLVVPSNQSFKLSASHFQPRNNEPIEKLCKNDIKVINTELKALDELAQGKVSRAMEFFSAKKAGVLGVTVDNIKDLTIGACKLNCVIACT